jgi:hypothetical protein
MRDRLASAKNVLRTVALELRQEGIRNGLLRSVDATRAAELFHSIADDIFERIGLTNLTRKADTAETSVHKSDAGAPPPKHKRAKSHGALFSPERQFTDDTVKR